MTENHFELVCLTEGFQKKFWINKLVRLEAKQEDKCEKLIPTKTQSACNNSPLVFLSAYVPSNRPMLFCCFTLQSISCEAKLQSYLACTHKNHGNNERKIGTNGVKLINYHSAPMERLFDRLDSRDKRFEIDLKII